jgi:sugar phosphate permease
VRGCPFFYGYVILVVVTLIKIFKGAGQNNLLGFATDDLLADISLAMSRTEFASLCSFATLLGAVMQPCLGVLTDRFGARTVLPIFLLGLAAGLAVFGSVSTSMGTMRFVVAGAAMVGIRSLAIGGLEQATATNLAQWFVERRGRAVAVSNFVMTFGQLGVYTQVPYTCTPPCTISVKLCICYREGLYITS